MSNSEYQISSEELAGCIDHTLLSATAAEQQIRQFCREAVNFSFHTVCVNGRWVSFAAEQLHRSNVKVGSVISLPLGADATSVKVAAARQAVSDGADEIDMVADLAAIIDMDRRYLLNQLKAILKVCRSMKPKVILKVIIESAALTRQQKIFACEIAARCSIDFIKTSTGLNPAGGAAAEDIKLMKQTAASCKIKAAGGIKTAKQVLEMLNAGAERIGTSSAVEIMNQFKAGRLQ